MQKSQKISIEAVKSKIITSKSDLILAIELALKNKKLAEKDILIITSKVVSVTQGKIVGIKDSQAHKKLVQGEADKVLGGKQVTLTLKNDIFTPWAGIDLSNTQKGTAVLWPEKPYEVAQIIQTWLQKNYKLKKVGVIISDSFCIPLRKGVMGLALGYAGFVGVVDKRGTRDLYGNKLSVTQEAVADTLATIANLVMGQVRRHL
jgi:F420-0:gamma-glutamyl ligase